MSFNFDSYDEDDDRNGGRRALLIAFVGFIALLLVVVLLAAGPVRRIFSSAGDYSGDGTGSVRVVVNEGDSASTIGATLAKAGVVKSATAFTKAATDNPKSREIGPGTYNLHEHMKAALAVTLMLAPGSQVAFRVTIPEGLRATAIIALIAKNSPISLASLKAALGDPSSLGLPAWAGGKPEGFLFPATYEIQPGETATQALSAMVTRFNQAVVQTHLAAGAKKVGLTEYGVVTLASIVQHEAQLAVDFPKIAAVFENRLKINMALQSDATEYYILGANHGQLTASDLANPSPYNTRIHTGLPPTPIDSPGTLALTSVLHHAKSSNLYFVTIDKSGHTAYAKTLARFNHLVAVSQANGVS
jgi:UPF0755 protein